MHFSDLQRHTARFGERDSRLVMVSGPTRSGKTEAAIAGFMQWSGRAYTGQDFALVTKSQIQMDAIVLSKIYAWCDRNGIPYYKRERHLEIPAYNGGVNKFWYILGVDGKDRAAKRIQGMGLPGVFIDEFPKMPDDLIDMLTTRMLEYEGSKMVATMNPEGPDHWAKIKYIDRIEQEELSGEYLQYAMTDNPILSPEAIEELAKLYTGPFYRRMILGEWAASTGLVHPVVKYQGAPKDVVYHRYEVAMDFGRSSVTHAVLVGYHRNGWHVLDEWRHDGRELGQMPVVEQAANIFYWATAAQSRSIAAWAVPHDAHGLAEGIQALANGLVYKAVDKKLHGISVLNQRLEGNLTVDVASCPALRGELAAYKWSDKRADKGDDVADKESAGGAHGVDALRYWAATAHAMETGVMP